MVATNRHWADETAERILRAGRPAVVSTGISPSGEIHIGNLREVLTADAVVRALQERGATVRFNYVADNFDPLRRVYPFLDATRYGPLVGRPLSEIPGPVDDGVSYAEHFLAPFLEALATLHVHAEIERADQMYKSGRMTPYILRALERRDRIAEVLADLTGKRMGGDWSPFLPLCPACGRITDAVVEGFSASEETVDYRCACGSSGTVPMAGGGKLVWRVDWPARWMLFGVSVEPFGKDHATRGGSYETGERLAREVFDGEPPLGIPYEWIRLRGRGDMSSSKGNVLSIARVLELAPPLALRYLVIRERPQRTISFDPGLPLLQLVDDVDAATAEGRDERALELSRAGEFHALGVPFKHLVVVAQAADFDLQRTLDILARTGYREASPQQVSGRMAHARRWLEEFAPDDLRFRVQRGLPREVADLDDEQRAFLARLGGRLQEGMDGQAVHELIYELSQEFGAVKPARLFRAIYVALLGKPRGPRAGWFVSMLGPEFCARRFREASGQARDGLASESPGAD